MAEPPSVLYAVCLEHTCDGRKVDLGLKCWRRGRADDNELTFLGTSSIRSRALSRGVEARAAITVDETRENRMGNVVPQPWVVLGRRLHREQPALPCNRVPSRFRLGPSPLCRRRPLLQFWYSGSCCATGRDCAPQRGPCSPTFSNAVARSRVSHVFPSKHGCLLRTHIARQHRRKTGDARA